MEEAVHVTTDQERTKAKNEELGNRYNLQWPTPDGLLLSVWTHFLNILQLQKTVYPAWGKWLNT